MDMCTKYVVIETEPEFSNIHEYADVHVWMRT